MTYQKQLQEAVVFYSGPACTDKETALFDEFRNALLDYAKANRSQWLIMHSYDVSFFKTSFMKFIIQQYNKKGQNISLIYLLIITSFKARLKEIPAEE